MAEPGGDRLLICADASSVHTRRWVQAMAARGFDCVVLTRRPATVPGAHEVVALRPGGDAAGWFLALRALRRFARQWRPRWVHGHYVTSYGLWAAAAARASGAPLVLTAWGSDVLVTPRANGLRGRLMRALVGRTARGAALLTADADDALDALVALAGRAGAARRARVLWGADVDFFRPGEPAPGFEVASLRAWEPNYRIDALLHAFAALRSARPATALRLHLLGGGEQATALQALARSLAIEATVSFAGRVDDAAMRAVLQRCRVSVSVPASDATSVSVLESMACGLPVVASELPANRALIDAPELLVAGADPPALARALTAALLRVHDDPAWAQAVGRRNRARVERDASRASEMDRMAALYRSLVPAAGQRA
jgi:glycosyltransferase involved in cell wall biosynthesis